MKLHDFINRYRDEAEQAGRIFELNPVVILAQAALESGWGESTLARVHKNLFGLMAYGTPNEYWHGCRVSVRDDKVKFRKYADTLSSFMDYARLISRNYIGAARMSFYPEAFAKEIAYSRYICETNGDNREEYRQALCMIVNRICTVYNQ